MVVQWLAWAQAGDVKLQRAIPRPAAESARAVEDAAFRIGVLRPMGLAVAGGDFRQGEEWRVMAGRRRFVRFCGAANRVKRFYKARTSGQRLERNREGVGFYGAVNKRRNPPPSKRLDQLEAGPPRLACIACQPFLPIFQLV